MDDVSVEGQAGTPHTISLLRMTEQTGGSENPFVGLRPFESRDEPVFFGRREQTAELLKRLEANRFVAVVGGSGSGKSSLVKAGLIPVVKRGFLVEDRLAWCQITMRPGQRPLETFAEALETLAGAPGQSRGYCGMAMPDRSTAPQEASSPSLLESLQKRRYQGVFELLSRQTFPVEVRQDETLPDRIGDETAPPAPATPANLLLVVDQFEEVFRYTLSDADQSLGQQARTFVDLLLKLAAQDTLRVFVVTTMRADFIGACEAFPGLTSMMNKGMYLVPRLTRPQLKDAIERPIQKKGASISPRLLDRLLNECTNQPQGSRGEVIDQLPLLQHALMRTWNEWKREGTTGDIDVSHYERAGTMQGALADHLDKEVWPELSETERGLAERLFRALTDTDTANRQIRRPTRLSELEALTGQNRTAILLTLGHFSDHDRSFVTWETRGDDPMVDICHESLIRKWGRLGAWATAEAAESVVYGQLVEAAALHENKGRGEKGLWTDPVEQPQFASALQLWRTGQVPRTWAMRLRPPREADMLGWDAAASYREAVSFLEKSRNAYEAKQKALKDEQTRRWYRLIAAAGVVVGAVAIGASLWIGREQTYSRAIAAGVVPALVKESANHLNADPIKAVLFAAEAVRRADEGRDPAIAGLAFHSLEQALRGGVGEFAGAIPSGPEHQRSRLMGLVQSAPDGWYALDSEGDVFVSSGDGLSPVPALQHSSAVTKLISNATRMGRAFADGSVLLQDLSPPFKKAELRGKSPSPVSALEFSPDGRYVAVGAEDGGLIVWDASQGKATLHDSGPNRRPVSLVRFSRDLIVAADQVGLLRQWSLVDGVVTKRADPPVQSITAIGASPLDSWLVLGRYAQVEPSKGSPNTASRISPLEIWSIAQDRWTRQQSSQTVASPADSQDGVQTPDDDENVPTDLVITPNRRWVLTVLSSQRVLAYPLTRSVTQEGPSLRPPVELLPAAGDVRYRQLNVSPNGRWLAIQSDQDIHLIDLESLARNARLGGDAAYRIGRKPHGLLFTADNRWLVVVLFDGSVRRWRLDEAGTITRPPVDDVSRVLLDRQGRMFLSGTQRGQVLLAGLGEGAATPMSLGAGNLPIVTLALSSDGQRVLAGNAIGTARVLEIGGDLQDARSLDAAAAQFSTNGTTLWTSDQAGQVTRWPIAPRGPAGSPVRGSGELFTEADTRYSPPTLTVGGDRWILVFKPNSQSFASARFLDASTLSQFHAADDFFNVLAVSPDGRWVLTTKGEEARLLDLKDAPRNQPVSRPFPSETAPAAAAFSPDGQLLAMYRPGPGLSTISTETFDQGSRGGQRLSPRTIDGSGTPDQVQILAVSAGGRWLMRGDVTGQIVVFDLQTPGAAPLKLPLIPSDGFVVDAAFANDTLITVTNKGVARRWTLAGTNLDDLKARARQAVGRNFTCVEWREAFWTMPYERTFPGLPGHKCE